MSASKQRSRGIWAIVLFFSFCLVGCVPAVAIEKAAYTKYNIHVQQQLDRRGNKVYQASYANYTNPGPVHLIVPAGSPITITKISGRSFSFVSKNQDFLVDFEYSEPRMGMKVNEYISLITSPDAVPAKKFSSVDQKGIKEGKALVGMTRDGVMTALGYPAAHKTPSLNAPVWVYWTNRFGTIAVEFGEDGKVVKVKD